MMVGRSSNGFLVLVAANAFFEPVCEAARSTIEADTKMELTALILCVGVDIVCALESRSVDVSTARVANRIPSIRGVGMIPAV